MKTSRTALQKPQVASSGVYFDYAATTPVDARVRDAMRMGKLMDPESEPTPAVNSKAMKMKHASDARLEGLLDMKTMMLEMSGVGM
jgi:hypothetical protein